MQSRYEDEEERDQDLEQESQKEYGAPFDAVCRQAPRQSQEERRQELREAHHAQGKCAPRQIVDVPSHRNAEHQRGDRGERPGDKKGPEVVVVKHRKA